MAPVASDAGAGPVGADAAEADAVDAGVVGPGPVHAEADGGRRSLRRDVAGAALAAALSLAVAVCALQLWSWHPSVPLSYDQDAIYYSGVVKGTLDHGWYLHNPDVGAPFGLDNHDFPIVSNDSLQLLIVKGIGLFTDRPFLAGNAFYLLTFALNAIGAFAALRWRRTPRQVAVLGGAVFGVLPLHFMKGTVHLFFASAYLVPIGCAMALTVLAGEPLLRRRPGVPGLRGLATLRTGVLLVLCAAIASASLYYAVFTMLLLGTGAVARGLLSRSRRALAEGLGAAAAIGAFAALNQLPTLLYRLQHGPNPVVAARGPQDAELYGLKLTQIFLPVPGHRIGLLADLTERYRTTSHVLTEATTSVGLLASLGLVWLLVLALARIIGAKRSLGSGEERNAAFSAVVILLWATTGGMATLFSYAVSSQLRTWSRMAVFLGFLGVVGALGLLDRTRRRWAHTSGGRALPLVLAAVFLVAALDQTSSRLAPNPQVERSYHAEAGFVRHIEALMPAGSAILQLPYVAYPEGRLTHRMAPYDQMRLYLHSTQLRWSFGAMHGRPEDWHADVSATPLRSLLAGAAAGGMTGLVVDRFGYTDGAAALEAELAAVVGQPAVVDEAKRLAFWDLRPLVEDLRGAGQPMERLAELTLRPLHLGFGDEFLPAEWPGVRWRWSRRGGTLTLDNPGSEPREAIFSLTVRTRQVGPGTITFRMPDGTTETVREAGPEGVRVERGMRLPPGRSTIRMETTVQAAPRASGLADPFAGERATDPRRLVVQLVDAGLVPLELCDAATALGAPDREAGCLEGPLVHRP